MLLLFIKIRLEAELPFLCVFIVFQFNFITAEMRISWDVSSGSFANSAVLEWLCGNLQSAHVRCYATLN
jgi:hypothetical protein